LLIPDVGFAGRLLSLLLGIGSLFLVWKLAVMLFGKTTGIFALTVVSLYTIHIAYSTTSSSEISYLFFLLLSLLLFFSYLNAEPRNLWYLSLSGCALSISESIRFEAWVFFFGMVLLLAFPAIVNLNLERGLRSRLRPLLAFGIAGGIWPIFMMAYCYRNFGDPMYLVNWNHLRVQQELAAQPSSLGYQLSLMPGVLLISLSPFALAAGIYGWVKSFAVSRARALAALTLLFFAIQNYQLLKAAAIANARYTLTMGTLLTIFAGYGLELLSRKILPGRTGLSVFAVVALLAANSLAVLAMSEVPNRYADKFASVSPRLRYPSRVAEVGKYLRTHMGADDAVVLDDYNEESNTLADASGLPLIPGARIYEASVKNSITVEEFVNAERPRFLVYADRGSLRRSWPMRPGCGTEQLGWSELRCVLDTPVYRVYEVHYR
jgi:4-amino-4-deoxy-L-arabinose transferase-like glycosyltransferase